ncbi:MAG: MFS transporter [Simkaniaceae bacterium]|nr:MFS transporter [Simkaniaceae bacterium]
MSHIESTKLRYPIQAWTIWFLSAFFMFYKYALEVSPSVMTTTLMSSFHINGVQLGNLVACYFYAYLLLQIPAGILIDRFGPRKVTTISIALCALGSFVFANATTVMVAGFARFAMGVGAAFAVVNCLKLTANWFPPRQFAFMTGLMMSVAMLGAVGGQAPLAAFIKAVSWHQAIETIALAGFLLAILFWFIVRDKAPDHRIDKALVPAKVSLKESLKEILSKKESWWISIYGGFSFAPVMIFGGLWGVSFISEAYQLSTNLAAQSVSLIFIGMAIGSPLLGWFSDWIGRRKVVIFYGTFFALLAISTVIYFPAGASSYLGLLLFLFGFFISSFLLCFTIIRESNKVSLAATAVGFMNAFQALFGAGADLLAGKILDLCWGGTLVDGARIFSTSSYQTAFLLIPLTLIISLLSLLKVKETHSKISPPSSLP